MTDKKIIANDIDVSGCEYYATTSGVISNVGDCYISISSKTKKITKFEPCGHSPNCYYKRLQCKTAECEKYKQALGEIEEICQDWVTNEYYCYTAKQIQDIISKMKDGEQ